MKPGIDYIGVGVGAIIVNDKKEILLLKRGKLAKNERGKWEIPGGAVNYGETLEDALVREVQEETGLTVVVDRLLTVSNHILKNEGQHWVSSSFYCHTIKGEPVIKEPDKTETIGWFSLKEALALPLAMVTKRDLCLLAENTNRV
jgi:8-oxo-dGTP diphosphatase